MSTRGGSYYGAVASAEERSHDQRTPHSIESTLDRTTARRSSRQWRSVALVVAVATIGGFSVLALNRFAIQQTATSGSIFPTHFRVSTINRKGLIMPDGVNVGSWLSLEDYFFAGQSSVEVATPDDRTAAVCLPPLHTGMATGPTWHSETDLLDGLRAKSTLVHALNTFHAHRNSYLDFDTDLTALVQLGIYSLRIPISWCLTDHDPADIDPYETNETKLEERFTCPDPFYDEVLWPAVSRKLLVRFLKACSRHGVKATLDMHTYPGATSPGTFSGLWPRWPRFWTHGDQPATDNNKTDIGRGLWQDMVEWIESLDDTTLSGLGALTPMNEPAHLAGYFGDGRGDDPPYLPPLPEKMAKDYLSKLASAISPHFRKKRLTTVPNGPHLRVFSWLDDAIETFRRSSLPGRGIQLAVNVHESVLNPNVVPGNDGNDPGGRHPGAMHVIAAWWRGVTTLKERSSWAILDIHHYHAWEPQCQGASDGHAMANYTCSAVPERTDALKRCSSWATVFRQAVDQECGPGANLMSGEMSVSTHHNVRHACNDLSTLKASYLAQVHAAKAANVKLYWWSLKMPYGGSFRPAWSFSHFMWLMGVLPRPDQTDFGCGDHIPIHGEPNDDSFPMT